MKKIILIVSIISVLFLSGCNKNQNSNNDVPENSENQVQEEVPNNRIEENTDDNNLNDSDIENTVSDANLHIHEDDIFPYSSVKIIDQNDLIEYLDIDELEIANNEIFARHGHEFSSKYLADYFIAKSWYTPIKGEKISVSELNDIEQQNVQIINERIDYLKEETIIFENDNTVFIGTNPTADWWYEYSREELLNMSINDSDKLIIKYRCKDENVYHYINGNILSILIIVPGENGTSCKVYNIDMLNQKMLTNEELIRLVNVDYKECIKKVKEITLARICTEEAYKEIKLLCESENNTQEWYEQASKILIEKYNIESSWPRGIVEAYEYEMNNDNVEWTSFYLNENGDLCFVRTYIDNLGSQSHGEYMYNLTQDKVIDEFDVYAG